MSCYTMIILQYKWRKKRKLLIEVITNLPLFETFSLLKNVRDETKKGNEILK